jgi:redox-sensitive bicupin YhaK (pirin superfamily)
MYRLDDINHCYQDMLDGKNIRGGASLEAMPATVEIRRAADRAVTKTAWLNSRHSFSFGDHYDPGNTHHGVLLVNNDDIVAPAAGFDTHRHHDMEIVTWVLDGSLAHRDSTGHSGVVYPGLAQRMSAGPGLSHSEKNASTTDRVRFVQMWALPRGSAGLLLNSTRTHDDQPRALVTSPRGPGPRRRMLLP